MTEELKNEVVEEVKEESTDEFKVDEKASKGDIERMLKYMRAQSEAERRQMFKYFTAWASSDRGSKVLARRRYKQSKR